MKQERGSALVPAVIGVTVFAYLALEMLDFTRASAALIQAHADRARLLAAADAGIALSIHALAIRDPAKRLEPDGRAHAQYFDGVSLQITVQDEAGLIAINHVGPDVERRLFAVAGVEGDRLNILVDSLEDWKDYDEVVRPNGAEQAYYAPIGIRPRDDEIRTIEELANLRGMDDALLRRITPAITVFTSRFGTFEATFANPLASKAMSGASGVDVQTRLGELAGQRPVLEIGDGRGAAGRMFSISVNASLPNGGYASREVVVEFSGDAANPYWIRYVQ